jgi:hypothetical protein
MADTLIMRVNSARYRSLCGKCKHRVRVGKRFVIDPVDRKIIYHEACAHLST